VRIEPTNDADHASIAAWRYEPPLDFYNGDEDEILNPERWFFAHDDDGELIGFYYYEPNGDVLDYGLGLRPDLVGGGLGLEFFRNGLEFGRARYRPKQIRLYVAAFNGRAIKVYERAGFVETGRHIRTFARWGDVEFIEMDEQR
jgi:ribosomal-protein-alanine N-acetyltransferase